MTKPYKTSDNPPKKEATQYKVFPNSLADKPKYYSYRNGKWYFKYDIVDPPTFYEPKNDSPDNRTVYTMHT